MGVTQNEIPIIVYQIKFDRFKKIVIDKKVLQSAKKVNEIICTPGGLLPSPLLYNVFYASYSVLYSRDIANLIDRKNEFPAGHSWAAGELIIKEIAHRNNWFKTVSSQQQKERLKLMKAKDGKVPCIFYDLNSETFIKKSIDDGIMKRAWNSHIFYNHDVELIEAPFTATMIRAVRNFVYASALAVCVDKDNAYPEGYRWTIEEMKQALGGSDPKSAQRLYNESVISQFSKYLVRR